MTPATEDKQPQLDEKVWQAWLDKGAAEEKVAVRKYRIFGALAFAAAVGIYLYPAVK